MPFAWTGVSLHAAGASVLRVRLRRTAGGGLSLAAADGAGRAGGVGGVAGAAAGDGGAAGGGAGGLRDALFAVDWVPGAGRAGRRRAGGRWPAPDRWGWRGAGGAGRGGAYPDLAALAAAVGAGEPVPAVVLACAGLRGPDGAADAAGPDAGAGMARPVRGAGAGAGAGVAGRGGAGGGAAGGGDRGGRWRRAGEGVADLAGAAVWGLVRSAQSENPGRVACWPTCLRRRRPGRAGVLAAALGSGEPELAVRDGAAYGRRLARPGRAGLAPAAARRLRAQGRGRCW